MNQSITFCNIAQEGLVSVPLIKVLLGRNAVQKIQTLPDRESIDLTALEEALQEIGQPCYSLCQCGYCQLCGF
jgi:hypothetical protein